MALNLLQLWHKYKSHHACVEAQHRPWLRDFYHRYFIISKRHGDSPDTQSSKRHSWQYHIISLKLIVEEQTYLGMEERAKFHQEESGI